MSELENILDGYYKYLLYERPRYANKYRKRIKYLFENGYIDIDYYAETNDLQILCDRYLTGDKRQEDKLASYEFSKAIKYYIKYVEAYYIAPDYGYYECGPDQDCHYVKYEKGIPDNRKVPGLAQYLEKEYEVILAFIRDEIFEKLDVDGKIERIPVYLSADEPTDSYELSDDFIASLIKRSVDSKGINISIDEIKKILKNRRKEVNRLGEYFPFGFGIDKYDRPYIKIYYLNTNADYELGFDDYYYAELSQCLAHEFMHYVHNVINPISFNKSSEINTELKEAVADFAANLYLLNRIKDGIEPNYEGMDKYSEIARKKYDFWQNYEYEIPYSYALLFFTVNNNEFPYSDNYDDYLKNELIDKLLKVLKIYNHKSINNAYNSLFDL